MTKRLEYSPEELQIVGEGRAKDATWMIISIFNRGYLLRLKPKDKSEQNLRMLDRRLRSLKSSWFGLTSSGLTTGRQEE
uniref:Uncharacterized protein n=1 Tax=Onchocerca volvulus TaxID=6282 RepID=A0A8R1Y2B6_ONCVO